MQSCLSVMMVLQTPQEKSSHNMLPAVKYNLNFGINIGWAKSFILELSRAPKFDYYSFSDQDDYWEKDKLVSAVNHIKRAEQNISSNIPILYYSNLYVADSQLHIMRETKFDKRIRSLESVFLRWTIGGCVMVMNSRLQVLIKSRPLNDDMFYYAHDVLPQLLTYSFGGEVICDSEAHMLYRQHKYNIAGSPNGFIARIRKEWREMLKHKGANAIISKVILKAWSNEIVPEARHTLKIVAEYKRNILSRLKIVFSPKFRTWYWRLTLFGKAKAFIGLM